jgi:DNA-binding MarR family transcriptional regulator
MTTLPAADAAQPSGPSVLDDLLCFDLYAVSRAMTALYRPLLDEHGLTYPQYLVLVALGRRGPGPIRDLGAALRLDHGTLTPLLRRLEARGLVARAAGGDARSVTVSLSAAGEELRPFLDEVHCAVRDAVGLSTAEMLDLQATLGALRRSIEERVRAVSASGVSASA